MYMLNKIFFISKKIWWSQKIYVSLYQVKQLKNNNYDNTRKKEQD